MRQIALALGAICLLCFIRASLIVSRHLPLNFNEGWNAYHAADLAAGRPLYPDPSGLFFNNYPPLSFLVVAPIGRALGDQMLAGRVVALASFAVWIALLAVAAGRLRCSRTSAAFGALVLAIHMFVFNDFYVGVNDPQIFGHAVQALGLVVLLGRSRSAGRLAAAAVLLAAGVFIKTNLIALPLAAAGWLLVTDRPSAWRLIAFGAAAGVVGSALCLAVFGEQFAAQVLSPRGLVPAKASLMAWQWTARMALPLAMIVWLALRPGRDRQTSFGIAYAVTSILAGVLFALADGVYWNTFFDADCAVALTAALVAERIPEAASGVRRIALPLAYLLAPVVAVAFSFTMHWFSPRFWLDPRWYEKDTAAIEIDFVRRQPGPVLCEDLTFCYWAGKPIEADFFNLQQRATREAWRTDAIARRLDGREFSAAQTGGRDLGPRFAQALRQNYRVDHTNQWGEFWVPK